MSRFVQSVFEPLNGKDYSMLVVNIGNNTDEK